MIIPEQFGFVPGKSCVQQLFRVSRLIRLAMLRRMSVGMLRLNLRAAFDMLWHQGLLHKLFVMGLPPFLLRFVRSLLTYRRFCLKINGVRSTSRPVVAGVPKGAMVSPTLFNCYLQDVPRRPPDVDIAEFADDTALISASHRTSAIHRRLQVASNSYVRYFQKWKVHVNGAKFKATLLTRKTTTVLLFL